MSNITKSIDYEVNWKPLIDYSKNKQIDKSVYFQLIIKTWYFYNIAHPELDVDKKFTGVQNLKNCLDYILKVNKIKIFKIGYMIRNIRFYINKFYKVYEPNFHHNEIKLLKETFIKESLNYKPVTFTFLKQTVKEEIYNFFVDYWYDKKYDQVTIEMFGYIVKPLVLSKIKNPNSKIRIIKIFNRFKSWINFKAPENEKVLAIKKSIQLLGNNLKYKHYLENEYSNEEVIEEDVIEEDVIEEDVIEEDVIEEDVIEEDVIEEDVEDSEEVIKDSKEEDVEDSKEDVEDSKEDVEDSKEDVEATEEEDDDATEEEDVIVIEEEDFEDSNSKKRRFEGDVFENPKKKMKGDFSENSDMLKKEFIKKVSFDKFNIIIKNASKSSKPIDLKENDAIKLGVEMILKLSELGMVKNIIFN